MGAVTNLASRRAPQSPKHQRTFTAAAGDYSALEAARAYLDRRGFAIADQQGNSPQGFMLGEDRPKQWRTLSPEEANDMHGWITSADFRRGDVTIALRPDVHSSVIEAFLSSSSEAEASAPVSEPATIVPFTDGNDDDPHYRRISGGLDAAAQSQVEKGKQS